MTEQGRDWDWGYHGTMTAEEDEAMRERRVREASRAAREHRGGTTPVHTGMVSLGMGLSTGIEEVDTGARELRSAAVATGVAGAGLLAAGASRKTWWGRLFGMVPGAYLLLSAVSTLRGQRSRPRRRTGATGTPKPLPARAGRLTQVELEERMHVDRSPDEVYERVRDLENLPQLLHGGHHVHVEGSGRIHWAADIGTNVRLEWDGEIIDDEPGEVITWASTPEAPIDETGSILFDPGIRGGTDLTVRVAYRTRNGVLGAAIGRAMKGFTSVYIAEQLARLKASLETQHVTVGSTK